MDPGGTLPPCGSMHRWFPAAGKLVVNNPEDLARIMREASSTPR